MVASKSGCKVKARRADGLLLLSHGLFYLSRIIS
jgi:hypothetical protein